MTSTLPCTLFFAVSLLAASAYPATDDASCDQVDPLPTTTLSGHVLDSDGVGIEGAHVQARFVREQSPRSASRLLDFHADPARSTGDGSFELPCLVSGGTYDLIADVIDHAPNVTRVSLPTTGQPVPEVKLTVIAGAKVCGRVVDTEGEPIGRANVGVKPSRGWESRASMAPPWSSPRPSRPMRSARSGANGGFEIRGVGPGTYRLEIARKGFAKSVLADFEVTPEAAETARCADAGPVLLARGATIEGQVFARDGQPVSGIGVYCKASQGTADRERKTTTTDTDGRFSCQELYPGAQYRVRVEEPIIQPTQIDGVVAPTREPLRVVLRPRATLRGRVLDPSGVPAEGVLVSAIDERSPTAPIWANAFALNKSDESGSFELRGVPPERVRLLVSSPGWLLSAEPVIDVPADGVVDGIELQLRRGGRLLGEVLDSQGRPAPNALIEVSPTVALPEYPSPVRTDEQGRFLVSGLRAGSYSVVAEHSTFGKARDLIDVSEDGQVRVLLRLDGDLAIQSP